jgi:hypothetical protein
MFSDSVEFVEIIFAVFDVGPQSTQYEVVYDCLIGREILNDIWAEVGRLHNANIMQVIFSCKIINKATSSTGKI